MEKCYQVFLIFTFFPQPHIFYFLSPPFSRVNFAEYTVGRVHIGIRQGGDVQQIKLT